MLHVQRPQIIRLLFRSIHPSRCFYTCVWGIILGFVFSLNNRNVFFQHWLWLVVAILLLLFSLHHATVSLLPFALASGLILANFRLAPELSGMMQFDQLIGTSLTIKGVIVDDPDSDSGQLKLHLNNLAVQAAENSETADWISISGTLYVALSTSSTLERSDIITLSGKLSSGFGTFVASLYRPTLQGIERSETGDIFARLKSWFAERVHDFLSSPAADLGLGYLMGQKSGLPASLSDALRAVGMTHVVVASGAHLGILTNAARKLFGKLSKFAGTMFAILMVAVFVMIVGFTPSMTRAALVTILSLTVGYVGRRFTPFRLLSFVAAITLLIAPLNLINLGWQLSFASFFALLIIEPVLRQALYGGKKPPWLASMIITSLATNLVCAPILIYNFGTLSLLSFVANLVILPTLPYAMLLVFLTGATTFLPFVAQIFAVLASALLDFHIWIIKFLELQKMFIIELSSGDFKIFFIYFPLIISLLLLKYQSGRRLTLAKTSTSHSNANMV